MHTFKYTLKTLLRNKMLIFWTFAFPIILGTFFHMAFSDIEESEMLDIINIAIIDNDDFNNNLTLKKGFEALSEEKSEERLFSTIYVKTEDEARKLLEEDEIVGYLNVSDTSEIVIKNNGINETVFNTVTDELIARDKIIADIINKRMNEDQDINFEAIIMDVYESVLANLENSNINIKNISRSNLSYTMIEYYTLIAMSALYGGIIGMVAINYNLPNMCTIGKRVAVSPRKKSGIILSSALASFVVQLVGLLILFLFTIFILNVEYGSIALVILLSLVGALSGLSLGIFTATIIKANDNTKTGLLIAITMLGCFLSGMMGITMKYVIDKNIPIINKLNPVAMITDGFYSLYYYDTLDRYIFNLISLLVFSGVLLIISSLSLRRQKYDSI